jgi:hypothetical protein
MEIINCNMLTMYIHHDNSTYEVYIIVNESVLHEDTMYHTAHRAGTTPLFPSYIMTMTAIFAVEIPLSFTRVLCLWYQECMVTVT